MTDNEKRIFIAEACGWECVEITSGKLDQWEWRKGDKAGPAGWISEEFCRACGIHHLPDYLGDLNAMAVAINTLTERQHQTYSVMLIEAFWGGRNITGLSGWKCYDAISRATARQRAEAFIETLKTEKAES